MNQCDSGHDTYSQTRLLPTGGDENSILCCECFVKEMEARQEQGISHALAGLPRPLHGLELLPKWDDLKIYADFLHWTGVVVETITVKKRYLVAAETLEQATRLIEAGDTMDETELGDGEVISRTPDYDTIQSFEAEPC